jgi:hypothetical protein
MDLPSALHRLLTAKRRPRRLLVSDPPEPIFVFTRQFEKIALDVGIGCYFH